MCVEEPPPDVLRNCSDSNSSISSVIGSRLLPHVTSPFYYPVVVAAVRVYHLFLARLRLRSSLRVSWACKMCVRAGRLSNLFSAVLQHVELRTTTTTTAAATAN